MLDFRILEMMNPNQPWPFGGLLGETGVLGSCFLSDLGRNSVLTFSLFISNFVEEESQTAPERLLAGEDCRNAGGLARLDQGDGAIHVVPAV